MQVENKKIPRFFRYVPHERNKKWKWFSRAVYFFLTAAAIGLTVGIEEEVEYNLTPRVKASLTLVISLLIAILVNGIKRTLLCFVEIGQMKARYDGNWKNLFAASCSKLHGGIILFFIVLAFLATIPVVYYKHASPWISILSAVGVGPLLIQLFHFDKYSDAEGSAIIEETRKGTGYTLAVDYHIQHLHTHARCSSGANFKRYILIPSDCDIMQNFETVDNGPIRHSENKINFSTANMPLTQFAECTYSVDVGDGENLRTVQNVLIEYATPLKTLFNMSKFEKDFGFIKKSEIIYETKMFYGTLKQRLFDCTECKLYNFLVPYDPSELEESGKTLADLLRDEVSLREKKTVRTIRMNSTEGVVVRVKSFISRHSLRALP